ncbi:MAG: hypothetical protein K2X36_05875 [Microbacteriaceae bacterium]|nr:hypothetical protein [Microbacteriaceae bacterium]
MTRRLTLAVLPLALLVASLAACAESARIPPPENSSAVEPLFASDEEALAAATEAYEEYLAVLDSVLQAPRPLSSEFDGIAAGQALEDATSNVQQFLEEGLSITGPRSIGSVELQQLIASDREVEVIAYFCEDVNGVLLLDSTGASLTTEDRPDHAVFQVTVTMSTSTSIVVEREFWSNEVSC